jgi:acetyl-CoA synthetase
MTVASPVIIRARRIDDRARAAEAEARAAFSWELARSWLDGLPGGAGLNIAYEAVDRHATGPRAGKMALRMLPKKGDPRDVTYAELAALTNRFANVLDRLGVGRGERVFILSGRILELYVAVLGTLKHGSVAAPLFSAFGPDPICQRLQRGDGVVLVTTPSLYERKVAALRPELPALRHVLVANEPGAAVPEGTADLGVLMAEASDRYTIPPTDPEDPALLHFTSGTTGTPKGALHVHQAVVAHHATGRFALDLHPDDVFWCTADPGWVTGTSYGIISPLTHGVTCIVDEADLDPERWYGILERERVTVWYTAPTAIRMLMKAGDDLPRGFDLSALRFTASVGEPLNPEAVLWGDRVLGLPFHDNWWQTETGGIMVANTAAMDIRPGSMGLPLPGVEVALLRADDEGHALVRDGHAEVITAPDVEGLLALKPGWPSMFRAYLHDEERYRACFVDGWYVSGDLVRRDADGYLWFISRADDVIKTAGHLIGPFEVESVLLAHPAVAEAGVYGVPDPVAGAVVHAVVSLKAGHTWDDALQRDLLAHARRHLGPAVAPRLIQVADSVPKTRSGKIMRRVLRARELGLPEGDLSTMEGTAT